MEPKPIQANKLTRRSLVECKDDTSCDGLDHSISALSNLSTVFDSYFEKTQEPWYITQAIICQTCIVSLLPDDHEDKPGRLYGLGLAYLNLFERYEELDDINSCIDFFNQAVSLTPDNHPKASRRLSTLGISYSSRFRLTGKIQDLNEGINFHIRAVALAHENEATLTSLNNLAGAYMTRFQQLGNIDDLDLSIDHSNQAIQIAPDNCPHLVSLLGNLGSSYILKFESTRDPENLYKAASCFTRALKLTPPGDPNIPRLLDNLGSLYGAQFKHLGKQEDLTRSIEYHTHAVSLMPDDHPYIHTMIAHLVIAHTQRFEHTGEVEDINQAISYQTRVVSALRPGNPDAPRQLNLLGDSYLERFNRLGNIDDADQAIKHVHQAVVLTPESHSQLLPRMSLLGLAHHTRFEHSGQLADLDASMEWLTKVVSKAQTGDPILPKYLGQLGNVYMSQFEHGGDPKDIATAIEYLTQAVSLTPKDVPEYKRISNLGHTYSVRFEYFGRIEDIDSSIELLGQALKHIPLGHPDMPATLSNIGRSHILRFEHQNRAEDNDKAIDFLNQAIELTPPDNPDLPGQLNNLAVSYLTRFERLGRQEDINKAIELLSQGASLFREGHPNLPSVLNQLGLSYQNRFRHSNEIKDIDNSIIHLERALLLLPVGHRDISALLNSLCASHLVRFRELGNSHDIIEADGYITRAFSLIPDGHPDIPGFLLNFGQVHLSRFEALGDLDSLKSGLEYFKRSAESTGGHPRLRLQAARLWADIALSSSTLERLNAFNAAINIVPQLVWLGSTITQRYDDVYLIGDLAMEAAAAAIQAEEYELAIEWLEQGRSIVWNQTLQLRTPLDRLHSADSSLAEKLNGVASRLHHASSRSTAILGSSHVKTLEQIVQEHHRLAVEYADLIQRARKTPGFDNFLKPKKFSELVRAAYSGPVVIVNIHKSRCDALILPSAHHDIVHLPLPKVTYLGIMGMCSRLERSLQSHGIRERGAFRRPLVDEGEDNQGNESFGFLLGALWVDIVKPILSALNYLKTPEGGRLPHVTWCTTGASTFLPFHAAGLYDAPGEKIFEYVILSYTPTISALLSARDELLLENQQSGILAIGQESVPGQSLLPGTTKELACIKTYAETATHYSQLKGSNGTILATLAAMESHSWVHLACHASQHVGDPTESGFFLQDGTLNLDTIIQKAFKNKGLAFLSACQTAKGDSDRPDEAVHLASGMVMAGYPSVIATMWSIRDDDAPLVAESVYSILMKDGKMDCRRAAEALQTAMARLREKVGETAFVDWVPYIHIGVS
ncbi:CHAT domain-containing protein [Rhizoctonia solani]|nr:CHAT domain-containing protein [Rhizoctonia solani]